MRLVLKSSESERIAVNEMIKAQDLATDDSSDAPSTDTDDLSQLPSADRPARSANELPSITDTSSLIHDFYASECDENVIDAPVHLFVDTSFANNSISLKAYNSGAILLKREPSPTCYTRCDWCSRAVRVRGLRSTR